MTYREWKNSTISKLEKINNDKQYVDSGNFHDFIIKQVEKNPLDRDSLVNAFSLYTVALNPNYYQNYNSLFLYASYALSCKNPNNLDIYNGYNYLNGSVNYPIDRSYEFIVNMDESVVINAMLMLISHKLKEIFQSPSMVNDLNNGIKNGSVSNIPENWYDDNFTNLESGYFKELVEYVLKKNPDSFVFGSKDMINCVLNLAKQRGFFDVNLELEKTEMEIKKVDNMVYSEKLYRVISSLSEDDAIELYTSYLSHQQLMATSEEDLEIINQKLNEPISMESAIKGLLDALIPEFALKYKTGIFANVDSDDIDYANIAETYDEEEFTVDDLREIIGIDGLHR